MDQTLAGDLGAFEALVERRRDGVYRAARVVGPADAESDEPRDPESPAEAGLLRHMAVLQEDAPHADTSLAAGRYVNGAFEVGETISFGDVIGRITAIDPTATLLDTADGQTIRVPNQLLLEPVVIRRRTSEPG